MFYRSIGSGVKLIHSSYTSSSVKIVLASQYIVKETMAIKVDGEVVLLNDDNIEYYSILNRKGLGSWKSAMVHATSYTFGGLVGSSIASAVDIAAGGKDKSLIAFIKLKNDKKVLVAIADGYKHLLRSKRKIKKDDIKDDDLKWIRKTLDEYPVYL